MDSRLELLKNTNYLPEKVGAYLEWSTCSIRVNAILDEIRDDKGNLSKDEFKEVLYHELFHLFQICTSGYLDNILFDLRKVAFDIWKPFMNEEMLVGDTSLLNAIEYAHKNNIINNSFSDFFSKLNKIDGLIQLCPNDLIESAAYLFQKKVMNYTNSEFLGKVHSLQKRNPNLSYIKAFKYMYDKLGETTFDYFFPVCYTSLNFENPVIAFAEIVKRIQKNEKLTIIIKQLKLNNKYEYLDNPISFKENEIDWIYREKIKNIKEYLNFKKISDYELMSKPYIYLTEEWNWDLNIPLLSNPYHYQFILNSKELDFKQTSLNKLVMIFFDINLSVIKEIPANNFFLRDYM